MDVRGDIGMIDPASFLLGFIAASCIGCVLVLVIAILGGRAMDRDFPEPPIAAGGSDSPEAVDFPVQ